MVVCLCEGIALTSIQELIRKGARTLEQVSGQCGAGAACGACKDMLLELLDVEPLTPCRKSDTSQHV